MHQYPPSASPLGPLSMLRRAESGTRAKTLLGSILGIYLRIDSGFVQGYPGIIVLGQISV